MGNCSVEGCDKSEFAAGLCSTHYMRRLRTGTTDGGPRARADLNERFWRRVEKRGPDECWPWVGKSRNQGYGYISIGGRGSPKLLSNRAAWTLTFGPIPEGQVVRHKNECHNRLCCNPAHLELGTLADNVADMWAKPDTPRANARLSEADVDAIRKSPLSSREIAPKYGVHHGHIRSIRNRRAWRDK